MRGFTQFNVLQRFYVRYRAQALLSKTWRRLKIGARRRSMSVSDYVNAFKADRFVRMRSLSD